MNYIGEQCFGCGSSFTKDDDVVVCPDCGTPYHRECYKSAGECINHQLHESGEGWKRSDVRKNGEASDSDATMFCTKCLRIYEDTSLENCENCGTPLVEVRKKTVGQSSHSSQNTQEDSPSFVFEEIDLNKEYLGFNPDEDFGGATLKEVSHFVDSNTFYYIPMFKRMKDIGSKISFNMICLFFPSFYFANRKMWLWALLAAFASLIFNIPAMLYLIGEQSSVLPYQFMQDIASFISNNEGLILGLNDICGMADMVFKICMCLFGNWLYMRYTVRSINKLKNHYGGPVSPQRLRAKGGVQPLNILFIILIIIGLTMAGYFAVTFLLTLLQSAGVI